MEIKYNDNPITIKSIEIDGKKMTKQFVQQIELEYYGFVDKKDKEYKLRDTHVLIESELEKLKIKSEIIGWINLHFEKDNYVVNWVGSQNKYDIKYIRTILFINSNGKLKRGYITKSNFDIFCKETPQIFI